MEKQWRVTSLVALALLGCLVGTEVEAQDSGWQKPAPQMSKGAPPPPPQVLPLPQVQKAPQYPQVPQVLPPPPQVFQQPSQYSQAPNFQPPLQRNLPQYPQMPQAQLPPLKKAPQYPQMPQVQAPPPQRAPQYPQKPQVQAPPQYPQKPQVQAPPQYPQKPQVQAPPQYPQKPQVQAPPQYPQKPQVQAPPPQRAPQYPQKPQVQAPPPQRAPQYPQKPQVQAPPPQRAPQYPQMPQVQAPPPQRAPQYPQMAQYPQAQRYPAYPRTFSNFESPQEPHQPYEPHQPQQPHQPYEPHQPNQPQQPHQPHQPYEPYQPEQPQQPHQPYEPHQPNQPQQPHQPYEPHQPNQPEQPHQPYQPHQPQPPHQPYQPHQPQPPHQPYQPHQPQPPHQPYQPHQPQPPHQPYQPHQPQPPHQSYQPHQPQPPHQPYQPHQPQPPHQPYQPYQPQQPSKPQQPHRPTSPQASSHYQPSVPEQPSFQSCEVAAHVRIPCGSSDISAAACEAISCCFDGRQCYFGKAVTIHCTKDAQFIVVVAKDATLPNIDLESISLLGQGQGCTHVDSNSEFAIYHFPVTACGSVVMEEPGVIIYENRMSSSYEVAIGRLGAITRDSHYELLFQCRYIGTSVETVVVEVLPLQDPPLPVAALGPIRVHLRLANGQCYTKGCNEVDVAYSSFYTEADYPVAKVLRDPVYVEVQLLEKTDPNLVLTLGRCWTTTSPNPHSLPQWDILINGCPYRDDRYLSSLVPVGPASGLDFPSHYRRFLFKMFTFVNTNSMEPLREQVYIHCSTAVCSAAAGHSCEPSCFRKQRDVSAADQRKAEPKVVVSAGPVIMGAPEQQQHSAELKN